jgi:NitT/TauT family transport system substrate-binding protein
MGQITQLAKEGQPKSARQSAWLWVVAVWLSAGAAVAGAEAPALPKVAVMPHWIPQAQFAGFYMAVEKGIYQRYGLEAVILDGGPRKLVEKSLLSGEAVFASHFLASTLKLRDEGVPLVHLAQITQRSALLLVAHKSSGIASIKDLDGKKVSLWPAFSTQPRALFRQQHLQVEILPQGATINLFMRGGVDAAAAMWYNEYYLIKNSRLTEDEVTWFYFDQPEENYPEDCLVCLADTWRTQPELCRRFTQATLAGWQYVLDHPEEALKSVMRRTEQAHTGTNRSHQRWMLARLLELIRPRQPGVALGELTREDYERAAGGLRRDGELKTAPTFEAYHVPLPP